MWELQPNFHFLLPWTHWSLVLWVMWCWRTAHWTGWFEWREAWGNLGNLKLWRAGCKQHQLDISTHKVTFDIALSVCLWTTSTTIVEKVCVHWPARQQLWWSGMQCTPCTLTLGKWQELCMSQYPCSLWQIYSCCFQPEQNLLRVTCHNANKGRNQSRLFGRREKNL